MEYLLGTLTDIQFYAHGMAFAESPAGSVRLQRRKAILPNGQRNTKYGKLPRKLVLGESIAYILEERTDGKLQAMLWMPANGW